MQRSNTGFGLAPTANLANVLTARGLDENTVNRFDSRHELEMPLHAGPFNIVPFAAVRATIYDGDFAAYNDNTGDDRRIWSSIGSRFSTSIVRADQDVRSQFFDLTGLRHIITPNATIWASGTNVDESKLPIYDQNVEALASGTVARVGVNNVFQTHRRGQDQADADPQKAEDSRPLEPAAEGVRGREGDAIRRRGHGHVRELCSR